MNIYTIAGLASQASRSAPSQHTNGAVATEAIEGSLCDGTVAYAFVVRDGLPLWQVWKTYFDGCPAGSFTVLVHSQENFTAGVVSEVGGKVLPPSQTIQGELRFKYAMVDAMLNLYGGVKTGGVAPNGCKPRWVHMASDACAPIEPCAQVHTYLAKHPGWSFVKNRDKGNGVVKSPQWMTLWGEHAFDLWERRDELRSKWAKIIGPAKTGQAWPGMVIKGVTYNGAPDEYVIPNELKDRGVPTQPKVLTYAEFPPPNKPRPLHYASTKTVTDAASIALSKDYKFVRKIDPSTEAISSLLAVLINKQQPFLHNILPMIF